MKNANERDRPCFIIAINEVHIGVDTMNVKIHIKQLGNPKIQKLDYALDSIPATLRALIDTIARSEAHNYNVRLQDRSEGSPIAEDILSGMLHIGKVHFGKIHSDRPADVQQAGNIAIQAFEDGLVRIFLNAKELTELDAPLAIREDDCLTFLHLAMLTGG